MKELIGGTIYNTDTATLVKSTVLEEDLTNGYTRYKVMDLYYGSRIDSWFLDIRKTTVDRCMMVIDVIEYLTPVDEEFVYKFRDKVKDVI